MSVRFEAPRHHLSPPPERRSRSRPRPINVQDSFLFGSLKENQPVVVALLTGKMIQGRIARFDPYLLLNDDGVQEILIYKHAIACIARASTDGF